MPSNIIGTAPNQVPTNADLGTMAYQDSNAVKVKNITFNDGSSQQTAASGFGFKNRIINGAMMIDQRNAGASVSVQTTTSFSLDRWAVPVTQNSKFSVQQNAGSVTPPTGFSNYLGVTSSSAYSVLSSDILMLRQAIEGFNVADFGWGTANAATVTLSFKVYSSLTGTFGGAIQNSGSTRSYPFTYSIPVANTWTSITLTIPGDTAGTWLTNNLVGMYLCISLGMGSTYSGTAGSWAAADYRSATGATSIVGTNGATFYITGVQLEKGSTATSFDYRPYGTELALCQRYFEISGDGLAAGTTQYIGGYASSPGGPVGTWTFKVQKRANPTVTLYSGSTTASGGSTNISKDMYTTIGAAANSYFNMTAGSTANAEL